VSEVGPRAAGLAISIAIALAASGCGGDDGDTAGDETSPIENPAATEASPEAPPVTTADGESGELSESDTEAVMATVTSYVESLNRGRGDLVCALIAPHAVDLGELPNEEGSCGTSVGASIGHRRPGGTPAWKRTTIREITAVSVGEDQARVTATVTHDFSDRKYVSIEEDVIYLERSGEKWLIAKPSGTFYRAVGYPEPPLRALTPP
jgi:hypothetical protein